MGKNIVTVDEFPALIHIYFCRWSGILSFIGCVLCDTLYVYLSSKDVDDIIDLHVSTRENMIRRMGSFFGVKSVDIYHHLLNS